MYLFSINNREAKLAEEAKKLAAIEEAKLVWTRWYKLHSVTTKLIQYSGQVGSWETAKEGSQSKEG